jgi:hypothetical protein
MQFMMIVKANRETEAGVIPSEELLAAMTKRQRRKRQRDRRRWTFRRNERMDRLNQSEVD